AVTATVAMAAWQFGTVLQRYRALKSGHIFIFAREAPGDPSPKPLPLNAFRSMLGDEPVRFIYVEPKIDGGQTINGLKRLFPEAQVVRGYGGYAHLGRGRRVEWCEQQA